MYRENGTSFEIINRKGEIRWPKQHIKELRYRRKHGNKRKFDKKLKAVIYKFQVALRLKENPFKLDVYKCYYADGVKGQDEFPKLEDYHWHVGHLGKRKKRKIWLYLMHRLRKLFH